MTKSDTIAKLAEALSKAQGEIKNASMDSVNPFFVNSGKGGKYADLAAVWDACREPLSKNGLSVVQVPEFRDGKVVVVTLMMHASGEWISGELELTPVKLDPQGIGSATTYGKRYALGGFAGVAPAGEDDDGNAALRPNGDAKASKTTNKSRESTTIGAPPDMPLPLPRPNGGDTEYISPEQLTRFHTLVGRHKWDKDDAKKLLADFGIHSSKHILKINYEKICGIIENGNYADYLDYKTNAPTQTA